MRKVIATALKGLFLVAVVLILVGWLILPTLSEFTMYRATVLDVFGLSPSHQQLQGLIQVEIQGSLVWARIDDILIDTTNGAAICVQERHYWPTPYITYAVRPMPFCV